MHSAFDLGTGQKCSWPRSKIKLCQSVSRLVSQLVSHKPNCLPVFLGQAFDISLLIFDFVLSRAEFLGFWRSDPQSSTRLNPTQCRSDADTNGIGNGHGHGHGHGEGIRVGAGAGVCG